MTELVPRHTDGAVLTLVSHGASRVSTPSGIAVELDQTALALWELCDGETTVAEMTVAVCALFAAPEQTVSEDITAMLATLAGSGLITWVSAPVPTGGRQ